MMEQSEILFECRNLHRQLFDREPNSFILEHYVKVHENFRHYLKPSQVQALGQLIVRQTDLIALEYFLRFIRRSNYLSQKMMILHYLTESHSDYKEEYFPTEKIKMVWLRIAADTFFAVFLLMKGSFSFLIHRGQCHDL